MRLSPGLLPYLPIHVQILSGTTTPWWWTSSVLRSLVPMLAACEPWDLYGFTSRLQHDGWVSSPFWLASRHANLLVEVCWNIYANPIAFPRHCVAGVASHLLFACEAHPGHRETAAWFTTFRAFRKLPPVILRASLVWWKGNDAPLLAVDGFGCRGSEPRLRLEATRAGIKGKIAALKHQLSQAGASNRRNALWVISGHLRSWAQFRGCGIRTCSIMFFWGFPCL